MVTTKIGFFLLCHRLPEHVIRLVHRLRDDNSFFMIHVDARADECVYQAIRSLSERFPDQVYLCGKRYPCYWGRFGIVQATISCIRQTIQLGLPFDRALLLSGQDYPIRSTTNIRKFLDEHTGCEFIESFAADQPNRWTEGEGEFNSLNRLLYWTIWFRSRHVQIRLKRRFPYGFRPFGGSMWWCLTRECVAYLDRFIQEHSAYSRYFRNVFIPDESFFQSIVCNSPYKEKVVSDDLRYADWNNPNPLYPRTLETGDFDRLIASSKLLARKFDERSQELLSLIDHEIDHRDISGVSAI